jgi:hypothetical protein
VWFEAGSPENRESVTEPSTLSRSSGRLFLSVVAPLVGFGDGKPRGGGPG